MILTGAKLEEIGKSLYGEIWVSVLSKRLRRAKRTIMRWRDETSTMPPDMKAVLVDLIDHQFAVLGASRDELTEDNLEV